MKLTTNLISCIKSDLPSDATLLNCNPGSVIYSDKDFSDKLVLITNGSVRAVDEKKLFSSYTISKITSPCIFGVSKNYGKILNELIISASSCSYYLIDNNLLSLSTKFEIERLQKTELDTFEVLYIYELLKNKRFLKEDYSTFYDFMKNINLVSDRKLDYNYENLIYADRERKGFLYGQLITSKTLKKFFYNTTLPRIINFESLAGFTQDDIQLFPSKKLSKFNKQEDSNILDNLDKRNKNISSSENKNNNLLRRKTLQKDGSLINGFRPIRAKGKIGSYESILSMIVEYYQLPTRQDTIKKAAEIINNAKDQKITQFLILLENFGVNGRLVKFDLNKPFLIPTPCIWFDKNQFAFLVMSIDKQIKIFDPNNGIIFLNKNELTEKFDNNNLITFSIGLHAPKRRFSINWLFPYLSIYKNQLIEVFTASFFNQIFALATPLLFQQIIDRVISKGAVDALSPLVILMLIFVLLEIAFASLRTFQFVEITNRIDINLGSTILSRLLRLNAKFFDSKPVGELSSRLNELENIRSFLTGTALTLLLDSIFSILYIVVLLFYSPTLTAILLLSIPLLFISTVGVTPITQKLIRKRAEAQAKTQAFMVEMLNGIQTIKLQNAELSARKEWENRHLNTTNASFKAILANTSTSNASQLINKITNIALIGVGTSLVLQNKLTLGELIAFRIISGNITQPLLRLASSWQNFQELTLSLQRVGEIVNEPLEVQDNESNNIEMSDIKGDILFEDVSYAYSNVVKPVLNSVSIRIESGTSVALIGQSGCGKSTLLKMIPRLYLPTSGRILIDNLDISKIELYSMRSQIGFVPQDCMLFEGTVFSNIAIGNPKVDANSVIEVSKLACAHDFIMNLPYGYGTPIGEKGSGLSGGQRQRIALARMLLEEPNMVILDEATSALDVDTEKQVLINLEKVFKDKTLLVITHRLSSIINSDKIIVMDNGRVDSVGSHEELMSLKGRYYAMYNTQYNEE